MDKNKGRIISFFVTSWVLVSYSHAGSNEPGIVTYKLFPISLASTLTHLNTQSSSSTLLNFRRDKKKIPSLSPLMNSNKKFSRSALYNANQSRPWLILVSLGTGKTTIHKTNDVVLSDDISNRYVGNHTDKCIFLTAIGLGWHFKLFPTLAIDLGITGYHFNLGRYSGIVHPAYNVEPDFDTLNYKYHASSIALLSEVRLFLTQERFKPYIFLGMGTARNHLSRYQEVPTNPDDTAAPMLVPFANHWDYNFSYGLGSGIAYMVRERPRWSIEYRYLNLGDAELGRTPPQATEQRLNVGPLKVNSIILSFYI